MTTPDLAAVPVRKRYEAAVETLTEKLQQDRQVLAALLCGSLSYDEVWEKSDIDIVLIGDEKVPAEDFTLTEDGIVVHANLMPRSQLKRLWEGGLQSSFLSSLLSRSRLLFSHDDSIRRWYDNRGPIGERDRQVHLLQAGIGALPLFDKARKWFFIKHDRHYALLYVLFLAEALARVEVIAAGEITGREVIHQALAIHPAFFRRIYTDLLEGVRDDTVVGAALEAIGEYLAERTEMLFGPVLDYLREANGPRGTREMNHHFDRQMKVSGVDLACDYLVERGWIERVGVPLRLTKNSRVAMDEAGYLLTRER